MIIFFEKNKTARRRFGMFGAFVLLCFSQGSDSTA
jgi:hypothetical protein